MDGNKRTGFLSAYLFLTLNGLQTTATEVDVVRVVTLFAANEVGEAVFAAWLRDNSEIAAECLASSRARLVGTRSLQEQIRALPIPNLGGGRS